MSIVESPFFTVMCPLLTVVMCPLLTAGNVSIVDSCIVDNFNVSIVNSPLLTVYVH